MCWIKKYKIYFPEEPVDESLTLEDVDPTGMLLKWYTQYKIQGDWKFWNGIKDLEGEGVDVELLLQQELYVWNGYCHVAVPAYAIAQSELVAFDVNWFNPGTIMHEHCHISYSLLKPPEVDAWNEWYYTNRDKGIMKYLFERKPYGLTNPVEGHAEIGRYLGYHMPDDIKYFYPEIYREVR